MDKYYKVVELIFDRESGFTLEAFEEEVMILMQEGWRCQGGICMTRHEINPPIFYQALVRSDADLPK